MKHTTALCKSVLTSNHQHAGLGSLARVGQAKETVRSYESFWTAMSLDV